MNDALSVMAVGFGCGLLFLCLFELLMSVARFLGATVWGDRS